MIIEHYREFGPFDPKLLCCHSLDRLYRLPEIIVLFAAGPGGSAGRTSVGIGPGRGCVTPPGATGLRDGGAVTPFGAGAGICAGTGAGADWCETVVTLLTSTGGGGAFRPDFLVGSSTSFPDLTRAESRL